MVIFYVLLVAYIVAVNVYAFLLVKTLRDKERQEAAQASLPLEEKETKPKRSERVAGKLCITGALGGAITAYVCMFTMKYRRTDLLLMVVMPLLGVLNIYLWVLLFRSGFSFFVV